MNRKLLISSVALVVCAAVAFKASSSLRRSPDSEPVALIPVELNDSLTNELSSFPELKPIDSKVRTYMDRWQLKGLSVAVMRNDSLLFAKAYGNADDGVPMYPGNTLRLASVSKLLTAVGIMTLQDRGMLSIKDRVFGPEGILGQTQLNELVRDSSYYDITVEHLLRHQSGFSRDPAFSSKDVKTQLMLTSSPTIDDFAKVVLGRQLRYAPGTSQHYSNFGYMLLSRIIETVTGQDYAEWMQAEVFSKAGCRDFHLASNYFADQPEGEVRHYTHEGDGKYIEDYHGNGKIVERSYGGNDITVLSGAGAWVASAPELMKLVASIDGRPQVPDIISKDAVAAMTEYFDEHIYSLGWNDTKPTGEWSRTGTFSGTCALVKYFPDGECWIMISNTSTWRGPGIARYTAELMDQCRLACSGKFPQRNLFYQ